MSFEKAQLVHYSHVSAHILQVTLLVAYQLMHGDGDTSQTQQQAT
jgi:hypothetical protein